MNTITADMLRNTASGRWAVAFDGIDQWRCSMAIGDGITKASMALVTRTETKAEAERIAERLRDMQPGLMPGRGAAYSVCVVRYCRRDYVSRQDRATMPREYQTVRLAEGPTPGATWSTR